MNKLKYFRVKRGISATAMACMLQISQDKYDYYEENPSNIPSETAFFISKIIGKKLSEIFLE